jgi:hypothetical protein
LESFRIVQKFISRSALPVENRRLLAQFEAFLACLEANNGLTEIVKFSELTFDPRNVLASLSAAVDKHPSHVVSLILNAMTTSEIKSKPQMRKSHFQECTDVRWESTPLGVTPWCVPSTVDQILQIHARPIQEAKRPRRLETETH